MAGYYRTDMSSLTTLLLPASLQWMPWTWWEQPTKTGLVTVVSKQLGCFPTRIFLRVKITQVFFQVFTVFFITPMQGNLHINKFWGPCSPFFIEFICKECMCSCVCLWIYAFRCKYAHVVYCCCNSWQRLSRWLSTIKPNRFFFCFFFPPKIFPHISMPSDEIYSITALFSHFVLITFYSHLEITSLNL